ncbi:hypothetical protein BpHYR1_015288 [Brachionus plicatilis]|uniref:Uncharacterized protein n=1 Tax=Brachionus plicatilis TaxID=10195 RepID=A0A3M7QS07_BRAPC|nr:hypothetical protein BpHYR1_015288 [Brachionus plicatilis]
MARLDALLGSVGPVASSSSFILSLRRDKAGLASELLTDSNMIITLLDWLDTDWLLNNASISFNFSLSSGSSHSPLLVLLVSSSVDLLSLVCAVLSSPLSKQKNSASMLSTAISCSQT